MQHYLKIELLYYKAVASGDKTFEIRVNDRVFQKGDTVALVPMDKGCHLKNTPTIIKEITYVTSFAQKDNWVVFGMKDIKEK